MSPSDQAARYLAKCPPAISGQGGHNTAYSIVTCIVHGFALDEGEAYRLLSGWNATCQPPWSERDLRHKIQDALTKPHDKPRGWKLNQRSGNGQTTRYNPSRTSLPAPTAPTSEPASLPQLKPIKYDIKEEDLPEAIPDGTRALINALFREGEGIRIAPARLKDDDSGEVPDGGGISLSREDWLKRLDKHKGNPNGIFKSSDKTGIYVAINPYKVGATKDADVTEMRHALVEFDEGLLPGEQLNLYKQMNLPCAAVIYSGGKSVHAWVKVDARDRAEYDERVRIIYEHFRSCGFKLDEKNKNPGRLSRLPNCIRFDARQELLYLNIGAESFTAWMEEIATDDLGERDDIDALLEINPEDMADVLLGNDWLNKGASCLISGPSGVGKSSLAVQCAILWALGESAFGIRPTRPLKSVIICAENDRRDNWRMVFGVLQRLGIDKEFDPTRWEMVRTNLIIRYNYTASGPAFIGVARRIADKEKPDLMWLDPTAAFVGDDLSKQTVIAQFFRNGLHPLAKARGFCWMIMNHFTKPPGDSKARKGWTASDHQYRGAGSYDLTGWARAGITLSEVTDGTFQLRLAKRGKLAGAVHPSGEPTTLLWLRHAQEGIFWEQLDPPAEDDSRGQPDADSDQPKREKLTKPQIINRALDIAFFNSLPTEGVSKRELVRRITSWMQETAKPRVETSDGTARAAIALMLTAGKVIVKDEKWSRGPNA